MRELFRVAADVQEFIERHRWKFCCIGGLALQRWGENRLTRDVDLSLLTGFGDEEKFIDALLNRFEPRRHDSKAFALQYRVLLLNLDGVGIDVSLAGMPFEEELIDRASKFEFLPGISIRTCSAEDLVVLKAFAARPQDWVDIRGILVRQGSVLDRTVIQSRLAPLVELKEEPEILEKLAELLSSVPA